MAPKTEKNAAAGNVEKTVHPKHNNKFVYYGTIVIFIITVIAFVIAPSLGNGNSGNDFTFGTWNGKDISYAQGGYFAVQVQQVKDQLAAQGYQDTGDQYFAYQVWRRAFENTVIHFAALDQAKASGIAVTNAFADGQLAKHPSFQENGSFSRRKYRDASSTYKSALRSELKENALKDRYVADITGVVPSKQEIAFIKAMAAPQRSIEYVAFPLSAYPDSERLAFAKTKPDSFRQIKLSRISITSSAKDAQAVLERIRSGAISFEDAAKNQSKDAYAAKGGDMGRRFAWELGSDFRDQTVVDSVLALGAGEVSAVFETVAGSWVFFRVDEAASAPDWESADLARSVTEYLNTYEKGRMEEWAMAQATEFKAAAVDNFAGAAASRSLTVKSTDPFPLNYGGAFNLGYFSLFGELDTTDKPEIAGAANNETFLKTVFTLQAGQLSDPIVVNGNAIVLRVLEISVAEDSALGMIDAYYSGVLQDGLGKDLAQKILQSPKLKDNFIATFSRIFAPQQ
ncbi:MAG TPA: SurA N-terminal domain-containing protein [Spirochaetales bacterium]|nr:SurA N-terminal domain-containing protein [Spirochaetales bacterium]